MDCPIRCLQSYNNRPDRKRVHFIPGFGSETATYFATAISRGSPNGYSLRLTRPCVARGVARSGPDLLTDRETFHANAQSSLRRRSRPARRRPFDDLPRRFAPYFV